jgi:transposase-like protein
MQVQVSLKIEIAASASLTQMEQQIQEAGQQAMREALKQAIRQWEDQTPTCPHCGQKQRRLEGTTRRVIATVFGRVEVPRRRFRCQGCMRRWCPATSLFSELKGGTISQSLQEAAMLAGCSWPYRAASSLLRRLSGAQISAEEIRLLTNRGGQQRAVQKPGGGRADLLHCGQGGSSSTAGRATDAGGVGWRLGV